MKTYEEMAQSALARIESCQLEKRKRRKTAAAIAVPVVGLCLALVLGFGLSRTGAPAKAPITDDGSIALSGGNMTHVPDMEPSDKVAEPTGKPEVPSHAKSGNLSEKPDEEPAKPNTDLTAKSGDAPVKPDTQMQPSKEPAAPGNEIPEKPDEQPPAEPVEEPPMQPSEEPPMQPSEEPPVKPDEEPPVEPNEVTPSGTENTDPEENDPPSQTQQEDAPPAPVWSNSEIGATYRMEGERELLTLTLLSTGEIKEIDITGWREHVSPTGSARPASEASQAEIHAASAGTSTYAGGCEAFGKTVFYFLALDENGTKLLEILVVGHS